MTAKIRVRLGEVEVEYEGPETFLTKELPNLVAQLWKMSEKVGQQGWGGTGKGRGGNQSDDPGTLAAFLKAKNATSAQVRKFLVTAQWLHLRGKDNLQTNDVTKALSENRQGRVSNPADCLNKNVKKGFCEKQGSGFYVTEEGKREIG